MLEQNLGSFSDCLKDNAITIPYKLYLTQGVVFTNVYSLLPKAILSGAVSLYCKRVAGIKVKSPKVLLILSKAL